MLRSFTKNAVHNQPARLQVLEIKLLLFVVFFFNKGSSRYTYNAAWPRNLLLLAPDGSYPNPPYGLKPHKFDVSGHELRRRGMSKHKGSGGGEKGKGIGRSLTSSLAACSRTCGRTRRALSDLVNHKGTTTALGLVRFSLLSSARWA